MVNAGSTLNGKFLVISGCYSTGFEMQDLFPCTGELGAQPKVWLEVSPDFEGRKQLKETSWFRYRTVVALGKFETGSTYGHLDGYRSKFTVYRVYSIGPLQKFKKDSR